MSRRGKITILLILLLLASGLMLIFRAAPLPLQPQSFALSDGSTMTLFKMTYGMNHEITYGTGWREHIAAFVPARFYTNFGLATAVFVPQANLLSSRDNVVI